MNVEITDQDAEDVAEVIRRQFATGVVDSFDIGLSYDHDGDECIRIVIHLNKDFKEKDFLKGAVGLNGHVIDVLRDDLKHLYPYIRFSER